MILEGRLTSSSLIQDTDVVYFDIEIVSIRINVLSVGNTMQNIHF